MSNDEGWEERMAARAAERRIGKLGRRPDGSPYSHDFSQWRLPDDPDEILPEILAARCLGIEYGDPGPRLPDGDCRECWGDRHVWMGNVWGMRHVSPAVTPGSLGLFKCGHDCHERDGLLMARASNDERSAMAYWAKPRRVVFRPGTAPEVQDLEHGLFDMYVYEGYDDVTDIDDGPA